MFKKIFCVRCGGLTTISWLSFVQLCEDELIQATPGNTDFDGLATCRECCHETARTFQAAPEAAKTGFIPALA